MKKTFSWYFPLSGEKIDEIWKNGLFTVDANVLLDLYRYNTTTRDNILEVLEKFRKRAWLTYQTASEFLKNRTNVIFETQDVFDRFISNEKLAALEKEINSLECILNGARIFPNDLKTKHVSVFKKELENLRKAIEKEKKRFPDYLHDDSILEIITQIFDKKIGPAYSQSERDEQAKKAQDRLTKQIPPGFKDSGKDSDKKYGDYFFWNQVLAKCKNEKKDVILVTSERKEDWWEINHGRIIGPRMELLEEAARVAGQVVLIYQTEHFLDLASEKLKIKVSPETVEDVKIIRDDNDSCVDLLEHNVIKSSDTENSGIIKFYLKRQKYLFTCSGHFTPVLSKVPKLDVELIQHPLNLPQYSVHFGTGTQFDFNIHVKSWDYGIALPIGEYVFKYRASCEGQTEPLEELSENS